MIELRLSGGGAPGWSGRRRCAGQPLRNARPPVAAARLAQGRQEVAMDGIALNRRRPVKAPGRSDRGGRPILPPPWSTHRRNGPVMADHHCHSRRLV
jgi:hypothetical protein